VSGAETAHALRAASDAVTADRDELERLRVEYHRARQRAETPSQAPNAESPPDSDR
jgi:hypothetical protein